MRKSQGFHHFHNLDRSQQTFERLIREPYRAEVILWHGREKKEAGLKEKRREGRHAEYLRHGESGEINLRTDGTDQEMLTKDYAH